ncbi:MAG: 50S ribosomal protein L10 [Chloroflexi bacterium GWC2_73_18]|nr:MAG: 50S ribosomal protein L10 [Chloroflexi bacterium GWC2_73_18]
MPTEAKRATVAELAGELAGTTTAIVSDYRGLSVSDIGAIRRSLREQGIPYRVVKNRLMRIAAEQAGVPELAPLLQGPSAVAFGRGDEAATARAFLEVTRRYRTVSVRGAILGGRSIDGSEVGRLATLPPRDVLLASLAGTLQGPLTSMAGLLGASLRDLARGLAQVRDQRARSA